MEIRHEHFKKLNPVFAHYEFRNEIQYTATLDLFITSTKLLRKDCAYATCNKMIRDRIVFGVVSLGS